MSWVDDPSLCLIVLMFLPNVLVFLHLVVTDCVYRTWSLLREDDVQERRERRNDAHLGGHRRRGRERRSGVPDEAREEWDHFVWGENDGALCNEEDAIVTAEVGGADYGSMGSRTIPTGVEGARDESASKLEEEEVPTARIIDTGQPSCSICLGEYAPEEAVVRLPCGHLYHEPCIHSWTDAHARCPLCNFDLREGYKHSQAMTV
ncbi:hypothetical protein ACHAXT_011792 [Thalassiosira profunda]